MRRRRAALRGGQRISAGIFALALLLIGAFEAFGTTSAAQSPAWQGIYESCSPADLACVAHLPILAQARLRVIINYAQFDGPATIQQQMAYAARAAQLGMSIVWTLDRFRGVADRDTDLAARYPALSTSMRATNRCPTATPTNAWFISCFVLFASGSAGTWGYYIGDELPVEAEPPIRHLVDLIYAVDSLHPRLFVAADAGGAANTPVLTAYGRRYNDGRYTISDATVIAQDYYPIGTDQAGQAAAHSGRIAHDVVHLAHRFGIGSAMVLQAHSLAEYGDLYPWCANAALCPYPTAAQMRAMRNAVLAQGSTQLVLWYSYFDLQRADNPAGRWSTAKGIFAGG